MYSKSNLNYFISTLIIFSLLLYFTYKLLFGENNIFYVYNFEKTISEKCIKLNFLRSKNIMLAQKIEFLKGNPKAYEEQARFALGMIKPDEKYYQVVTPE